MPEREEEKLHECCMDSAGPQHQHVGAYIGQKPNTLLKGHFTGQIAGYLVPWSWVETSVFKLQQQAHEFQVFGLEVALQAAVSASDVQGVAGVNLAGSGTVHVHGREVTRGAWAADPQPTKEFRRRLTASAG
ncbi:hypothetical protein VOLCADRAFT_94087 [Volvox carteri f. nagariensis]|uniref:Uncharacterized protein n=1 Tax=Volvox carteri f. nagariensis TaxID=3068 RepID=D8U3V9_VOLCA|nr:uncharacterized protein VOLCADRAFT_94087 [Volvox carteri f. nagariensis]EFJ45598.1 hypothetical protein VOLCADRAFT_94087 [Volvox carteri f. nagariensis]|eukprot:XP_002953288.1 hypothetical protein VOLCADRAFT_94087 [Volvox carteri f. nagariensis]